MQHEEVIEETNSQEIPAPSSNTLGRPCLTPTPDQQRTVEEMAGYGIPQTEIARHLRISPNTLRRRFRKELRHAAYDANNLVLASLFTMATTRHNVAAAIFWAKTRCAFRPGGAPYDNAPGAVSPPQKKSKPLQEEPSDNDRVVFTVYNNDGEPNADY